MIKKKTIATFKNGGYEGVYDWSGGIPLAAGKVITVLHNSQKLVYRLTRKETTLEDSGENQNVTTQYFLELTD